MRPLFFLFLTFLCYGTLDAQMPLAHAFAHNDYEHERPLLDALDNGFNYVEADVWLIEGELYVYHDRPENPDPERTLQKLYLNPLQKRIKANAGWVFKEHEAPFYLMIDIKSDGVRTYRVLKKLISDFLPQLNESILESPTGKRPLVIFVSGNRAVSEILEDPQNVLSLDGRPDDLGEGIPASAMPVVSDNYWKFSSWRGYGQMKAEYKEQIRALVDKAHLEGKKVRLWDHPDEEKVWKQLLELGVDLINTDKLEALRKYLVKK